MPWNREGRRSLNGSVKELHLRSLHNLKYGCHVLVHWCWCSVYGSSRGVYGRGWSNVFNHRAGATHSTSICAPASASAGAGRLSAEWCFRVSTTAAMLRCSWRHNERIILARRRTTISTFSHGRPLGLDTSGHLWAYVDVMSVTVVRMTVTRQSLNKTYSVSHQNRWKKLRRYK